MGDYLLLLVCLYDSLTFRFPRLALCDVEYGSLPENRNYIFSRLLKKVEEDEDGNPQHVANLLYGLSLMDVSWEDLDEEMCLSIERMIEKTKQDFDEQVSKASSFYLSLLLL
jgi:hypothetical protein